MKKVFSLIMAICLVFSLTIPAYAVQQWRPDKATVTITDNGDAAATAKQGQSGVRQKQYSINGGIWLDYIQPFEIDIEGTTTIIARVIDNAGNPAPLRDVDIRIDKTPPKVQIAASTTDWTKDNVGLHASAFDNLSGVSRIINPLGVSSDYFSAPENGTYTFIGYNNAGLSSIATIGVSNIEKHIEPLKVEAKDEWNQSNLVNIPKQNNIALSGVSKYQYRIVAIGESSTEVTSEEKPNIVSSVLNAVKDMFVVTAYADVIKTDWTDFIKPFEIRTEGIYRVDYKAVSYAGNIALASTFAKVDLTVPEAIIYYNQNTGVVCINATDTLSGVKSITLPVTDESGNNKVVNGSYAEFTPTRDGEYSVIIEDEATNKVECIFPITLPSSDSDDGIVKKDNNEIVIVKQKPNPIMGNLPKVNATQPKSKPKLVSSETVPEQQITSDNNINTDVVPKSPQAPSAQHKASINWLAVSFVLILILIILFLLLLLFKRKKDDEDEPPKVKPKRANNKTKPTKTEREAINPTNPLEVAIDNYFTVATELNQIKKDYFRPKIKEYLCANSHLLTYSTTDLNFELDYFITSYKPERNPLPAQQQSYQYSQQPAYIPNIQLQPNNVPGMQYANQAPQQQQAYTQQPTYATNVPIQPSNISSIQYIPQPVQQAPQQVYVPVQQIEVQQPQQTSEIRYTKVEPQQPQQMKESQDIYNNVSYIERPTANAAQPQVTVTPAPGITQDRPRTIRDILG